MSDRRPKEQSRRWKRIGLIVIASIFALLGIAWFDGGEEPLRPIVTKISVPEGAQ